MFFSIIIPVYNSEKTLSKLLNSILEQNFNNYEIIIINDGSVDNTEDIILSYKSKFNHYKYIFKENSGVSSTRNIGLQNVEGKYILFADADDYFENDYFIKLYTYIKNNKPELLCFNYYDVFSNSRKIDGLKLYNNQIEMNVEKAITNYLNYTYINQFTGAIWNKVYKTDILKKNNVRFSTDLLIGEDLVFNIEYFCCVKKVCLYDEKLYNYVQSENSIMRSYREKNVEHIINYIPKLIDIFEKYGYKHYETILYQFYISNLFGVIINESNSKSYSKGKENIKLFCDYALNKKLLTNKKIIDMKIKYIIYYLLIRSEFWKLIYRIIFCRVNNKIKKC